MSSECGRGPGPEDGDETRVRRRPRTFPVFVGTAKSPEVSKGGNTETKKSFGGGGSSEEMDLRE